MRCQIKSKFANPSYRADIDGLRAIAVLAVVIFHAFPMWLQGGFVGVDIFFVISGFLITSIILESCSKNSFSFFEFYGRRVRRIFPALLLVLIASLISGWLLLLADEYRQLGKHTAGGAGFISNFILWNESGYFDNSANTKPLLHLWSLSIEECFYLFWPLFIWFLWRKQSYVFFGILAVLVASFLLNINGIQKDIVATFLSPQTRVWELATGSLLSWLTFHNIALRKKILGNSNLIVTNYKVYLIDYSRLISEILAIFGISLICYSIGMISGYSKFPGWWALMPVIGTFLIILAGPNTYINKIILGNKLLVWIGLISYPLYLWHWPLFVFARISYGEIPAVEVRVLLIAISILLAWLTYRFIERPVRYSTKSKLIPVALIFMMLGTGIGGFFIFIKDGIPSRPRHQAALPYIESMQLSPIKKECFDIPYAYKKADNWFCQIGSYPNAVNLFVLGDSHAASMLPALEEFSVNNKVNILFAGASGCPPLLGIQSERGEMEIEKYNCHKLNNRIFDYVKRNKISTVLLVG